MVPSAFGAVVMPGETYHQRRSDRSLYIFDEANREAAKQLQAYDSWLHGRYEKTFGWKLDERFDLVLASPRQQIGNGYATILPNIKTVWFPSGALMLESMATSSWGMTLAVHEGAHLYQLNAKGPFPAALKKVFGNSVLITPFIIPVFIHPNAFTPRFLVEGNAVLNESRLNMGGRLHSGEKRAMALALIKENMIGPSRLINDQLRFPFGELAYLHGGYFQAHLAAKHGIEKTNQFFVAQGNRFLWPLILNKTFRQHFGSSYPQEIREYVHALRPLAEQQQSSQSVALIQNEFMGSLNHDKDRIWFLTSNLKQPPTLAVFDKAKRSWSKERIDLEEGKVFWLDNKPWTTATQMHRSRLIEYSLYGESAKLHSDPKYRGQIVTDMRAGKTAALSAINSWIDPQVLVNGAPYDKAHSTAILDNKGNVYYFRQNGSLRTLYRNREPVFKYQGFYGKPLEVTDDGAIYFIANTPYGSSLYRYHHNEIMRMLRSDRVIDARMVTPGEFLVVEVGAKNHSVHIERQEPKSVQPANYQYKFATENLGQPTRDESIQEKRYNSFREIRYSAMNAAASYSSKKGIRGQLAASFADPLEYHSIDIALDGSQNRSSGAAISYTRYTNFIDFQLRYGVEHHWWEYNSGVDDYTLDQNVSLTMMWPWLRHQRWASNVSAGLVYDVEGEREDLSAPAFSRPREETYGLQSQLNLSYKVQAPLGYLPWRGFDFYFYNKLSTLPNVWEKHKNASMAQTQFQWGFGHEFYLSGAAGYAWSEREDINLEYAPLITTSGVRIPLLTSHKEYTATHAGFARAEFQKSFIVHGYPTRFPIGVRRLAPLVLAQGVVMSDDRKDLNPPNIFEFGIGADIELLLLHAIPARLRLVSGYNTRHPVKRSDNQLSLTLSQSF